VIAIDTNLLLYSLNEDAPRHRAAYRWIVSMQSEDRVAISEFVLAELYGLLRNPKVLQRPLGPSEATAIIQTYRRHPRWRLVGWPMESRTLHEALWAMAAQPDFAFRRLFDARTALSLRAQGVTELATANIKDFEGFGFHRIWDPSA